MFLINANVLGRKFPLLRNADIEIEDGKIVQP